MKKHPRRAAALVALFVFLSMIAAPLEGAAYPSGIKIPDDPKMQFGDPDGPTILSIVFMSGFWEPSVIIVPLHPRQTIELESSSPRQKSVEP